VLLLESRAAARGPPERNLINKLVTTSRTRLGHPVLSLQLGSCAALGVCIDLRTDQSWRHVYKELRRQPECRGVMVVGSC
jgi:hypothetical protein